MSGDGFPRHRLDIVQTVFRMVLTLVEESSNMLVSFSIAPDLRTMSLKSMLSPAIFPRAQAHCSRTSSFGALNKEIKEATAPDYMQRSSRKWKISQLWFLTGKFLCFFNLRRIPPWCVAMSRSRC